MSNAPKTNPEDLQDDEEFDDEEEEGDYMEMDMGSLLQSLLVAEDGETNVPMALVGLTQVIDKHLTTQNKILVKILSKLGSKDV
jgi:hypothetical protein